MNDFAEEEFTEAGFTEAGIPIPFAFEGETTYDGRTIEPGALYWNGLPLPVFSHGEDRKVIGSIVDLERVGNTIVATMSIPISDNYALSLDGMDAEITTKIDPLSVIFSRMRVAGGTIIPREAWAWTEPSEKEFRNEV